MSDIVRMLRVSESDPIQQEAADYIEHQIASHEAMTQEIERLRADCAKLETAHGQNMREISRLRAELAALRKALVKAGEALNSVLIGGNHLALLIGADHPLHTATHEEASKHYATSRDTYEIWCCWRTMMHAGPALTEIRKLTGDDK